MHTLHYAFILCMALGAACGTKREPAEEETVKSIQSIAPDEVRIAMKPVSGSTGHSTQSGEIPKADTLYHISGTEPFWSLVVAKPEIVFTSMEGDTLRFLYQEPQKAAGRPQDYVQVFALPDHQQLVLRKAGSQCPCSDGMSERAYPFQATLMLHDRVLEGCGRPAGK